MASSVLSLKSSSSTSSVMTSEARRICPNGRFERSCSMSALNSSSSVMWPDRIRNWPRVSRGLLEIDENRRPFLKNSCFSIGPRLTWSVPVLRLVPHHCSRSPSCIVARLPERLIDSDGASRALPRWVVGTAGGSTRPVQVVAPALGHFGHAVCDRVSGKIGRSLRSPHQCQSSFSRSLSAFLAVALDTAGDDVLPHFATALGNRDDVVERQLRSLKPFGAILTSVFVSKIDVRPRKRNLVKSTSHPHAPEKPQYRRKLQSNAHSPDSSIVRSDHLHFAFEEQHHRFLPGDDT